MENKIMNYQVILFDFDGVLCRDRFYRKTLLPDYHGVYDWIQSNIFRDQELVRKWMKGKINSTEINRLIAENTGITYEVLTKLYEESIHKMVLEKEVMDLAKFLKQSGKKIGIVTDNMDIFTEITIPNHHLDVLFDAMINSADYGVLKQEDNGRLFDVALTALGENIENSLMIDDSELNVALYKEKGGNGFVYRSIVELKSFLKM